MPLMPAELLAQEPTLSSMPNAEDFFRRPVQPPAPEPLVQNQPSRQTTYHSFLPSAQTQFIEPAQNQ
ncbi:hypothetical protein TNCT_418871 [Trichonephila clavata]|uniref:Uncharacterized protein n=1 Tax=Trichonephila clavata TaxID=2740835 RepID=A0A8X6FCA8_TRICU|nr:hypothetical protein TNCT_418871 [Trichonephila clavata]